MNFDKGLKAAILAGTALVCLSGTAGAQTGEVQELRAQVRALMERIEKLEADQKARPAAPAATAAPAAPAATGTATATTTTASAAAPTPQPVTNLVPRTKLVIAGQVNRGVLFVDDGVSERFHFVDNNNSSTRIRAIASSKISDTWTAGGEMELEAVSNSTRSFSQTDDGPTAFAFNERKMEVWLENKAFGRIWFGQGDTASNTLTEQDLSGTAVVAYSDAPNFMGGANFRVRGTGAATGPQIRQAFENFDGLHRDDRIRYDTPNFGGFVASTSFVDDGGWDLGLRYSAKFGTTDVSAGLGYGDAGGRNYFLAPQYPANTTNLNWDDQLSGSVSVKMAAGFNVTAAYGVRDYDTGRDSSFWYGKVGYIAKLNALGSTAFAVDYYDQEDNVFQGDSSEAWGVYIVQNLDVAGAELYAGYRTYSYDTPGLVEYHDLSGILTGARIRF